MGTRRAPRPGAGHREPDDAAIHQQAQGATGTPGVSSVGSQDHIRGLDHRGDFASLGQAQLAHCLHRDRGHQPHAIRGELNVGYGFARVELVTLAGIWLRALSCMTDSKLSDHDG